MTTLQALGQQHRTHQLALRAATLHQANTILRAFNPGDVTGTWLPVEAGLTALILARAPLSAALANRYYTDARTIAGDSAPFTPAPFQPFPAQQLSTSLRYVGPYRAQQALAAGRDITTVSANADVSLLGTVGRYTLDGGRDALVDNIRRDDRAYGWERDTSGDPCEFCQTLADRGVVYSESGADFEAHDHCACFPVPAFS